MKKSNNVLYTVILDFRGGTYCSQVQSTTVFGAIDEWIDLLRREKHEVKYLGKKILEELIGKVLNEENKPIPLRKLANVWHTTYTTKQGILSINVVKTDRT